MLDLISRERLCFIHSLIVLVLMWMFPNESATKVGGPIDTLFFCDKSGQTDCHFIFHCGDLNALTRDRAMPQIGYIVQPILCTPTIEAIKYEQHY